jgi:hypothetical protein
MRGAISVRVKKERIKAGVRALLLLASGFLALPLSAQQQGPLPPPPQRNDASTGVSIGAPSTNSGPQRASSHITSEPPSLPVEQIVRKFTENEEEFRKERDNFTYRQTFILQEVDEDGQPDGEYRMRSDILFTPAGKRYEKVIDAPAPTLKRIGLEQQDLDDMEKVWPLVLTPEELPKYDVKYIGREQVDELGTYVFDILPKKLEKNQRYFQGRIWVEDKDLQIVKTEGKGTGAMKKKQDSAYPRFETFRENIEGHYWFPTYSRADDTLHFKTSDVHIRVTVRYENYKRFGSTIKIGNPTQIDPEKP